MHSSSSFIMHDDAGTHSMQALLDHMTDYNSAAINIQALSMVHFINPWGMTTEDERRGHEASKPCTPMANTKLDEACCCTATALA